MSEKEKELEPLKSPSALFFRSFPPSPILLHTLQLSRPIYDGTLPLPTQRKTQPSTPSPTLPSLLTLDHKAHTPLSRSNHRDTNPSDLLCRRRRSRTLHSKSPPLDPLSTPYFLPYSSSQIIPAWYLLYNIHTNSYYSVSVIPDEFFIV
jgi:hypothetical protein